MDAVLVLDGDPASLDATCKRLRAEGFVACRAATVTQVQERLCAVRFPVCVVSPRSGTSVADLVSWAARSGLDTEFVARPEDDAALPSVVAWAASRRKSGLLAEAVLAQFVQQYLVVELQVPRDRGLAQAPVLQEV